MWEFARWLIRVCLRCQQYKGQKVRERSFECGYVWGVRLLRVSRDELLTNLVLLGGDVALNPQPVARFQCSKYLNLSERKAISPQVHGYRI